MRTLAATAVAAIAWFAAGWLTDHIDALFLIETPIKVLAVFAALSLYKDINPAK